jgi:tetratricopeptide (TPR) repeat protein
MEEDSCAKTSSIKAVNEQYNSFAEDLISDHVSHSASILKVSTAANSIVANNSKYSVAYYNKASALADLGKYEEAIEAYDKAIAIDPNYAAAHYNKGNDLYYLGKYEEAIESYDKAIAINPNYTAAHYNKARALADLERYDEAIKAYDNVIKIDPSDAVAHYNEGSALAHLERYNKAIESFDKAISVDPSYAAAHYNKAVALHYLEKYDESIDSFNTAVSFDSSLAHAYYNELRALDDSEQYEEATESFDNAIAIDTNYAEAYSSKEVALCHLGKQEEAIESFNNAILVDIRDSEVSSDEEGDIDLCHLSQYDHAIKFINIGNYIEDNALIFEYRTFMRSKYSIIDELIENNLANIKRYVKNYAYDPDQMCMFGAKNMNFIELYMLMEGSKPSIFDYLVKKCPKYVHIESSYADIMFITNKYKYYTDILKEHNIFTEKTMVTGNQLFGNNVISTTIRWVMDYVLWPYYSSDVDILCDDSLKYYISIASILVETFYAQKLLKLYNIDLSELKRHLDIFCVKYNKYNSIPSYDETQQKYFASLDQVMKYKLDAKDAKKTEDIYVVVSFDGKQEDDCKVGDRLKAMGEEILVSEDDNYVGQILFSVCETVES